MTPLLAHIRRLVSSWLPVPAGACCTAGIRAPREELHWANSGGPRSRIVTTPLVSRLLSGGSASLGLNPGKAYGIDPAPSDGDWRSLVRTLLAKAGFNTAEQAWHAWRDELPEDTAMVIDCDDPKSREDNGSPRANLIAALVLGRCCGALFSPERPIIWSDRRLSRHVRLVNCDAESFTQDDHE